MRNLIAGLLGLACLTGCVAPAKVVQDRATGLGMTREIVAGQPFQHVLYRNRAVGGLILHVYIDGDGTPMMAGRTSFDPTPRRPVMLELMSLDDQPAIYLGRPCYHGLSESPGCEPAQWTAARYGEPVVSSLAAVVGRVMKQENYQGIAWFGHSGGGTLAVLLAPRFRQTVSLVTLGANLDTQAWASHAHQDLNGSLNPATDVAALPAEVWQRHYVGSDDRVVPPWLMENAALRLGQPASIVAGFRHDCCWERMWPQVLGEVGAAVRRNRMR